MFGIEENLSQVFLFVLEHIICYSKIRKWDELDFRFFVFGTVIERHVLGKLLDMVDGLSERDYIQSA